MRRFSPTPFALALALAAVPPILGAAARAGSESLDGGWRGKFVCGPGAMGGGSGQLRQDIGGKISGGKLEFVIHYNYGLPFDVTGEVAADGTVSVRKLLPTHDGDTIILSGRANSGELAASGSLGQRACSIAMVHMGPGGASPRPADAAVAQAPAAPVAAAAPPAVPLASVSNEADKLLSQLRAEVEKERQGLAAERQKLEAEKQRLAASAAASTDEAKAAAAERQQLEAERQKLAAEKVVIAEQAEQQRQRGIAAQAAADAAQKQRAEAPKSSAALDFDPGRYHALIIGNNNYRNLPKLKTAVGDADAVSKLLQERYGFDVVMLKDATRYQILTALAKLRATLKLDDNLLIYYAGHGVLDEGADAGYWLPVDAESDNPANWVSTTDLTNSLRAMDAQHVMIVADSCYSGTLLRGVATAPRGDTDRRVWLKRMDEKRSRTALTSGGLEPVADGGGSGHSVFTRAFLEALSENADPIDGQALFALVRRPVVLNADQTPAYADIRSAGHDGGDFILVPKALQAKAR